MDAAAATCADNNQVWIGLKVPDVAGVGLAGDYYLIIYISNGRSYESPGTGVDIVTT